MLITLFETLSGMEAVIKNYFKKFKFEKNNFKKERKEKSSMTSFLFRWIWEHEKINLIASCLVSYVCGLTFKLLWFKKVKAPFSHPRNNLFIC